MGKITVKHYINTRVAPFENNGLQLYPIYTQITYKRKTTQIKDLNKIYCTIQGFEDFENGKPCADEFFDNVIYQFSSEAEIIDKLNDSGNIIRLCLELIDRNGYIVSDSPRNLPDIITSLNTPLSEILIEHYTYWIMAEHLDNLNLALYNIFNPAQTVYSNIKILHTNTGIDLSKYYNPKDLKLSKAITIFIEKYRNASFIEFVSNNYNSIKIELSKAKSQRDFSEYLDSCIDFHLESCFYNSESE